MTNKYLDKIAAFSERDLDKGRVKPSTVAWGVASGGSLGSLIGAVTTATRSRKGVLAASAIGGAIGAGIGGSRSYEKSIATNDRIRQIIEASDAVALQRLREGR